MRHDAEEEGSENRREPKKTSQSEAPRGFPEGSKWSLGGFQNPLKIVPKRAPEGRRASGGLWAPCGGQGCLQEPSWRRPGAQKNTLDRPRGGPEEIFRPVSPSKGGPGGRPGGLCRPPGDHFGEHFRAGQLFRATRKVAGRRSHLATYRSRAVPHSSQIDDRTSHLARRPQFGAFWACGSR